MSVDLDKEVEQTEEEQRGLTSKHISSIIEWCGWLAGMSIMLTYYYFKGSV